MTKRYLLIGVGLVAIGIAAAAACSLRYDFTECTSNSDCADFNDPPDFYRCDDNNTCQLVEGKECEKDADCQGDKRCSNNTCSAADTGVSDTGNVADTSDTGVEEEVETGPDRSCETTTHCYEEFGKDYICTHAPGCEERNGTVCEPSVCRKATTAQDGPCPELLYPDKNVDRENVVILGSIMPTTGSFKAGGTAVANGIEMAVSEFYSSGARTTFNGQTIALVACDPDGTVETSDAAAEHLVDIGAPAIVGPLQGDTFLSAVENVTGVDNGQVLTIAPAATVPGIRSLKSAGDYSFQIIGNDRFQARAILDRLKVLLEGDSDFDIAVFYKEDAYGSGLQSELVSAVSNAGWVDGSDVHYQEIFDPLKHSDSAVQQNFSQKVSAAVTDYPEAEVAVFLGTEEMIEVTAAYIETLAQKGHQPKARRYVYSHGSIAPLLELPKVISPQNPNDTFMPLTEGVTPQVVNRTNFLPFQTRYGQQYDDTSSINAASVGYDAALLALLAMTGVPEGTALTGSTARNVIKEGRLQDDSGMTINFDSVNKFAAAKGGLRGGGSINVEGVSGSLDFDKKGEVRPDYIGTDTGVKKVLNNKEYDIAPTRIWQVDDEKVAGKWRGLPTGFLTNSGTIERTSPSATIPDNDSGGVTSTINVASGDCGGVMHAKVGVDIDHPAPKELRVEIQSPAFENGNPITVPLREAGRTSEPLKGRFPTTLVPTPGSNFVSLLANDGEGDWKLTVIDTSSGNTSTGTLNKWSLRVDCN